LSIFDGKAAAGTWTLRIYDDARGDTGSLQGWSVTICTGGATAALSSAPDLSAELSIAPSTFSVKAGDSGVQVAWQAAGAAKLAGFNLYRSATPGGRGELVAFVPAGAANGEYAWTDGAVDASRPAWYTLEAVNARGVVVQQVTDVLLNVQQ
jgi:hypothetical protein